MNIKEYMKLTQEQKREYFESYKKEWLATHNS